MDRRGFLKITGIGAIASSLPLKTINALSASAKQMLPGKQKAKLLVPWLPTLLTGGTLCIFSGTQPKSPTAEETGRLLAIPDRKLMWTGNGYSAQLTTPVTCAVLENGSAGWFRIYDSQRIIGPDNHSFRFDGPVVITSNYDDELQSIGIRPFGLVLSSKSLVGGSTVTIDICSLAMPV